MIWFLENTFPKGEGTNNMNRFARKHNVQLKTRYFFFQPEIGKGKRIAELLIRHKDEDVVSLMWDYLRETILANAVVDTESNIYKKNLV